MAGLASLRSCAPLGRDINRWLTGGCALPLVEASHRLPSIAPPGPDASPSLLTGLSLRSLFSLTRLRCWQWPHSTAPAAATRATLGWTGKSDRNKTATNSNAGKTAIHPTVMPSPDPQLVGWWKVQTTKMPEGKTLGLIGGSAGDRVCFSEAGHYNIFPAEDGIQRFRCRVAQPYRELDIWIRDLEPLTSLCLYTVDDDVLRITVAGRPLGGNSKKIKRPTEMRMDDQLNWAVIEMKRCKPPKRSGAKRTQSGWKLRPGRFIPDGFLDE